LFYKPGGTPTSEYALPQEKREELAKELAEDKKRLLKELAEGAKLGIYIHGSTSERVAKTLVGERGTAIARPRWVDAWRELRNRSDAVWFADHAFATMFIESNDTIKGNYAVVRLYKEDFPKELWEEQSRKIWEDPYAMAVSALNTPLADYISDIMVKVDVPTLRTEWLEVRSKTCRPHRREPIEYREFFLPPGK
jgi:hypothetical protein